MDYNAQWRSILQEGNFSIDFILILPDGYEVSMRGVESAGDNGSDADAAGWSYERTNRIHSLTVPSDEFYEELGEDDADSCLVELRGKRYRIVGVTGTDTTARLVRIWLKPDYEDESEPDGEEG